MPRSEIDLLRHILDECNYLIKESTDLSIDEFIKDERLTRAVCRSLEIIGEASAVLNPDFKSAYPTIPWRELTDFRNKIIHHYFGIDYDIIWDSVKNEIPPLKESIEVIIGRKND